MRSLLFVMAASFSLLTASACSQQTRSTDRDTVRKYQYEVKPDHDAFQAFHPKKAPPVGDLLLKPGDRLAICGDSITEQKMYSRIVETYLAVCVPHLNVTVRQYGWSGEKTDGFLRRMEKDCLTFEPTVATLAYGMNDSRYRPFDVTNGQWYEDHYSAIVRKFKDKGVRVVVGSPGCAGKLATWVKSRSGSLQDHNLNLCALRDIAMDVAEQEDVRFADIFWPMYQAQVFAPGQHEATEANPYEVAGSDGIHPGWAGHVIMAWSFLRSMGLDGEIGTINVNLHDKTASATDGHVVDAFDGNELTITSQRYPFCADGDLHDDGSIRSGTTLVPFHEDLNRFVLKLEVPDAGRYRLIWGESAREFTAEELAHGINLAQEFPTNPFSAAFQKVDEAVAAKQAFETRQIKQIFHGEEGRNNFDKAVRDTEAVRAPLAQAIQDAMQPVTHSIKVQKLP
ncbi:MAG: SGNH/GDSL hydrolase family protein [Pirellulaceae bacterium]